ncbi:hypothetical protein BC938DRAFT_472807 [Jimgerdemannia flammicorona]|uniref:UBC core domain-containing protein n=1 Tax=Jimgerdemannia flammicorona TaxID=994334 RepID=A0A433QTN9_9FUNG|nr:hypothetical protein BC938DRAFT_472807 [Jimgerdemannia flammicorona]
MDTWKLRLLQDIRELHFDPTPGVDVTIDDKDISQMCLVLTPQEGSPYLGLRLHFTVYIPTTYPMQPPEVTVNTSIVHPNVFGDFLCADVLKNEHEVAYDRALGYNGGYSPAYLLKNIFMNLLSFFGSNKVEQTGGYTASVNYQNHKYSNATICANFACPRCNFNMPGGLPGVIVSSADVAPGITPATSMDVDTVDNTMTAPTLAGMARPTQARTLDRLPEDVWALIADDLPDQAIHCFCQAYPRFARIVRDYNLIIRRGLVCFYLRKPFTEAILGIGIQATVKGRKIDIRAREFELFSQEAFANCHLRRGIWNEPFTHFLPVALSTAHFERALPAIRESLLLLAAENQPRCPTWTPTLVLQIIPKMCNQMVLNLVEACSTSTTSIHTTTRLCASEKALTGYYLLLHLAQMLVRHHPTLQTHISTRLRDFVASVASRHKSVVPDLGEFLIYAMLDTDDAARGPAAWRDRLSVPFLAELLTRQVVWQLDPSKGNRPHLAYLEPADSPPSLSRLRDAFVASVTSMKLVMFQVTFLKLVRQNPPSEDRYGYPLSALPERLLRIVHDIDDLGARVLDAPVGDAGIPDVIDAWDGFLTILDIPVPDSGPAPGSRKDTIAAFVSRHLRNAHQATVLDAQADRARRPRTDWVGQSRAGGDTYPARQIPTRAVLLPEGRAEERGVQDRV